MSETANASGRDFFSGMVERALGRAPALAPRLPMLFEPVAKPGPSDEALNEAPASSFAGPIAAGDSPLPAPQEWPEPETRIEVVRERTILAPAPESPPISDARPALVANSEQANPSPREERSPDRLPDSPGRDLRPLQIAVPQASPATTHQLLFEPSKPELATIPALTPEGFRTIHVVRHEQLPTAQSRSAHRQDQIQTTAPQIPIQHDKSPLTATNALAPRAVHVEPRPTRPVPPRDIARIVPAAPASTEPPINVTIGVVEVRVVEKSAPSAQSRTDPNHRTPMSLEDYLQRRRG